VRGAAAYLAFEPGQEYRFVHLSEVTYEAYRDLGQPDARARAHSR
jgi:hypothetical protein